MRCPRWDSNCIPGLENTGNPREHAESEAVRRLNERVRAENCGQCPHSKFARLSTPDGSGTPAEEGGSSLRWKSVWVDPAPALAYASCSSWADRHMTRQKRLRGHP